MGGWGGVRQKVGCLVWFRFFGLVWFGSDLK